MAKYIKVRGVVAWARVHPNNFDEFRGSKKWKISLYPDKENQQIIKDAGCQTRVKFDEGEKSGIEGKFYQFTRDVEKDFGNGKGLQQLTPPEVTYRGEKYDDPIGNGSVCELTLEVYPTKNFGNGTRLHSIDVIDLIVYNKDEGSETSDENDEPPFDVGDPKKVDVESVVIGEAAKKPSVSITEKTAPKTKGKKIDW